MSNIIENPQPAQDLSAPSRPFRAARGTGETIMSEYEFKAQYIAGEWRDGTGEALIVDVNPYNAEVIDRFPGASIEDVDAAYQVAAAR